MKVKVGVQCEYWNRPEYEVIDLPDGATQEEIENAAKEVALEVSRLNWWIEDQSGGVE